MRKTLALFCILLLVGCSGFQKNQAGTDAISERIPASSTTWMTGKDMGFKCEGEMNNPCLMMFSQETIQSRDRSMECPLYVEWGGSILTLQELSIRYKVCTYRWNNNNRLDLRK